MSLFIRRSQLRHHRSCGRCARRDTVGRVAVTFSLVLAWGALGGLARAQLPATGLLYPAPADTAGVELAPLPMGAAGGALPAIVDWAAELPPPQNQLPQNSCAAFAVVYGLKSYQERMRFGWSFVDGSGQLDEHHVFSPAFAYNQLNGGQDKGLLLITTLRFVENNGAAPWFDMPYVPADFRSPPPPGAQQVALRYTSGDPYKLAPGDLLAIKSQLNYGYPVVIGVDADEGLWSGPQDGVWKARVGKFIGYHAVLLIGYDDSKHAFHVLNSWGASWGDGGYFWLDYGLFADVVREAYVLGPPFAGARGPLAPNGQGEQPAPAAASVNISNLDYNSSVADYGSAIRFDGNLSVPAGIAGNARVVVRIYYDSLSSVPGLIGFKGPPVISAKPLFATPDRFAATRSAPITLDVAGVQTNWTAYLPYWAIGVPHGGDDDPIQTNLVAEPTLFVNNFAVKVGPLVHFFVRL